MERAGRAHPRSRRRTSRAGAPARAGPPGRDPLHRSAERDPEKAPRAQARAHAGARRPDAGVQPLHIPVVLGGAVRLVFYGTPALAVPALARLAEEGTPPVLVVTRRDRPQGRGLATAPSPVRAAAEARGIPVATPARASAPAEVKRIASLEPDLLVLIAYGQILSPELLLVPRIGALNLHFSLLPRHRGASPIQAAILAGDEETGVTTMWMTEKLDEGPLFSSCRIPIGAEEDAGSLAARLAELGATCLSEALTRIERGEMVREIQDSSAATYAPKLAREDSRLSLLDAPSLFARKVRAFAPKPGAYLDLER